MGVTGVTKMTRMKAPPRGPRRVGRARIVGKCLGAVALCLCACAPPTPIEQVHAYITGELHHFVVAVETLQQQAPAPHPSGWRSQDEPAIAACQRSWKQARQAYEHVEGAIAQLFPHYDRAVDGRFDEFASHQGLRRDDDPEPNAFNGDLMTGMHAVERILWAHKDIPNVRAFEAKLSQYARPRRPATADEARQFREVLAWRLVQDAHAMLQEFPHVRLDLAGAYQGVVDSLKEQREKVNLVGEGSDESRYAQNTLADMRANLAGGWDIYQIFRADLCARYGGDALDRAIVERFALLRSVYAAYPGDDLPPVPPGWSQTPSPEMLASPYGELWRVVRQQSDPAAPDSLVALMQMAQTALELQL